MPSDPTRHFEDPAAAQQRFLSLFLRSEREIFRYVAALVPNVADAEDIVQQTALVLWEKFDAYDPSLPFTPWACRFALNKTRQWIERRQRWQALLEGGLAEELAQRREELRPELDSRLRHLEGCLGKLPVEQLSLVEGYYYRRDGIENAGDEFRPNGGGHLQDASAGAPGSSGLHRECREAGGSHAMKLCFPSQEFDDAVAAVCHGSVSDEQARALNELLRSHPAARDEYILRVELHSRLASDPDLFAVTTPEATLRQAASTHRRKKLSRFDRHRLGRTASARLGGGLGRVRRIAGRRVVGMARVAAGRAQGRDQQGRRDAEPGGGCAVELRRRSAATGSASGPGLASAQIGFGAGGFLQRRAGGDRGAGRISDHFTQRRFLPHGQAHGRGSAASAGFSDCDSANERDRSGHGVRSRREGGRDGIARLQGQRGVPAGHRQREAEFAGRLRRGGGELAPSTSDHRQCGGVRVAVRLAGTSRSRRSHRDTINGARPAFGSIKTLRCSCISTSNTPRLQTGGCTTRAARVPRCPTAPSSAANGSRADGRPNKRWSFAA